MAAMEYEMEVKLIRVRSEKEPLEPLENFF